MKYVNAISIKKNHFLKNFTKTGGLLTGIGNEIQFFLGIIICWMGRCICWP